MSRDVLNYGDPLRRSLVASVARLHDMEEKETKETERYIIKFLFRDKGRYFIVTDKTTNKQYRVESYEDSWLYGTGHCEWSVYPQEREK